MSGTEGAAAFVGGDEFTPEEQAAMDSYRSGNDFQSGETISGNDVQDGKTGQEMISHDGKNDGKSAGNDFRDTGNVSRDGDDGDEVDGEISLDANGNARDLRTGKFVPKSAMLRYKDEAKSAKHEAQALRDNLIQTRERLAILTEATSSEQMAHATQEEQPPDPETDIFGYAKWQAKQIEELKRQVVSQETATKEQFTAYRMQEAFKSDVSRFRSSEPNFDAAYQHLVQNRDAELQALGMSDERARREHLEREAASIVSDALRAGQSPAQRLFALAKARGFSPKQDDPAKTAQAQLDRIRNGQNAAQSLRGAGGGGAVGEQLTVQKLVSMSDDEYASVRSSYISKHGKAGWFKLTGMS